MFSQPGAAPAPAPAHAQQPAAASPLRRRFSSAADLSAPSASAAPAASVALASPAAGLYSRVGGSQLDVRTSPLDRSQSFLDLSATPAASAAPAAAPAPARERSADAQQATASLPRRTSFSGTGLLHSRSQSLLDVRAHRNSIAGDPRVGQMMERRQRGLSKLRGLVIPERVPELPVLLPDLPEIKSVPPPPVSTRSSWTPSSSTPTKRTTATNWTRSGLSTAPLNRPASWQSENVAPLSQNHFSAPKPLSATGASPVTSWNPSTVATRENSRPSWSSSASVPKYSPAFKRKSLSVSSSLSSSLSSSREELRPLFEATPNTRPPPLPSSRPPPLQPPAEPKSLESIASSPTRSDISFDFKVGAARSPSAAPEADVLTPHSKGGGGDDSDDSAVSSSRSSQYSPPSSPLRRTLASGTDQSSPTGRVLKPKSVEAINRKNVLSSARHSSGRDLKAGSPLIQRKMPEDIATEVDSAIVTPIEDNSAIHTQEEKIHQYSQNTENVSEKGGAENLVNKGENNNANLYDRPDDDATIEHRHVGKQEVVEANVRRNINSTPVSHYKTEERLFRAPYSNFDQMNSTLQGKVDDRIAMVHHRTDNSSTTVIRRSMEIVTSVGPSKSTGDKQAPHWSTSRERHTGSVGDANSSFAGQKEGKNDEVRSNLEAPTDRFDTKEKNNRLSTNNNKFEGDETSKHQFATARSKFEDSSIAGRPTYQKSEESKVFPRQRKSDENSAVLRRQNAIEDNILELNGNDPIIDSKSPPVAAPRRYVTQWEASSPSNTSPLESPLSPVPPSVPPKPTSKLSNGSNGSITRQDSGPTLVKHFRGSSLDSTASDDNTLRDSVLYGSVSSLSSASSLITPQELQQLMNEANQSLDESGLCSPVTLEVIILHRDPAGGGVGITLAGGADYEAKEITVHKVLAGSPADRDGRLQKGDRILSINGHSMKGVTHQESLRILKSPSAEVVLVVMKKGSEGVSSPSYEEPSFGRKMAPFRVLEQLKENSVETVVTSGVLLDGNEGGPPVNLVLCKDGAGLGFSLDGGRDSPLGDRPLTVKKIFTGGAAEKQGQLKAGDELLAVAGSDVTNMTRIEAWTLMKKLPSGPVTISIRPKAAV
ncbi:pro-interleukin-16-like [Schistocerca americana]|uniref:pro-interleukin-16-like n=1 Tax=Schistocerca americana TaxID=7009 RepID=UPI001F4F650B|nr:pro-interleukin-16-like [Schistocerca americana]